MSLAHAWWIALPLVCLWGFAANAADPTPAADPWIDSRLEGLVDLYKALHAHPELSFHEAETSNRLAAEFRKAGAEVTTGVGGHGIVGILKNGPGPMVLVRTDMDALPVTEATGLPYASVVKTQDDAGRSVGVMHACGHDLHMTNAVGTASWLADHKDQWSGTVMLIGQPAEERVGGAKAMLKDGLYERFGRPDFALALHVGHDQEAGTIGYRAGPTWASSTSVDITVRGKGGHGAMPHNTVDPVVLAALLVLDLQTVVSREISPVDPAVLTVGSIHGGTKHNIIPDEVRLQLTVRAFRPEVRAAILDGIRRRAESLARGHRAPAPTVAVDESEGVPPTVNDPALVAKLVPAWVAALGADRVAETPQSMGAEDFGLFGKDGVPTVMFRLGTIPPDRLAAARAAGEPMPSLHSALYHPDPAPSLRGGVQAMTAAVVALLPPKR